MTDTLASPTRTDTRPATRRARRARRAGAVAATLVVTLAVWALGRLAGADYVLSDPGGDVAIDAVGTTIVTVVVALLGWATLAALERFTRRAPAIWTALAIAVAAVSMIPIFLVDVTPATAIALYLVHLAVLVLVPAMLWTRRPVT